MAEDRYRIQLRLDPGPLVGRSYLDEFNDSIMAMMEDKWRTLLPPPTTQAAQQHHGSVAVSERDIEKIKAAEAKRARRRARPGGAAA